MDKKQLSERDICSKYITPAVQKSGWDIQTQIREEVRFTSVRIIVRGKLHTRGEKRRADYVLYHQKNQPIAIIEAKDNKHKVGDGMQQALIYAEALDVPFAFSSNGDAFLFHDRTGLSDKMETENRGRENRGRTTINCGASPIFTRGGLALFNISPLCQKWGLSVSGVAMALNLWILANKRVGKRRVTVVKYMKS